MPKKSFNRTEIYVLNEIRIEVFKIQGTRLSTSVAMRLFVTVMQHAGYQLASVRSPTQAFGTNNVVPRQYCGRSNTELHIVASNYSVLSMLPIPLFIRTVCYSSPNHKSMKRSLYHQVSLCLSQPLRLLFNYLANK